MLTTWLIALLLRLKICKGKWGGGDVSALPDGREQGVTAFTAGPFPQPHSPDTRQGLPTWCKPSTAGRAVGSAASLKEESVERLEVTPWTNERGLKNFEAIRCPISGTHYSQRGFLSGVMAVWTSWGQSAPAHSLPSEQGGHRMWPEKVPWQ